MLGSVLSVFGCCCCRGAVALWVLWWCCCGSWCRFGSLWLSWSLGGCLGGSVGVRVSVGVFWVSCGVFSWCWVWVLVVLGVGCEMVSTVATVFEEHILNTS